MSQTDIGENLEVLINSGSLFQCAAPIQQHRNIAITEQFQLDKVTKAHLALLMLWATFSSVPPSA